MKKEIDLGVAREVIRNSGAEADIKSIKGGASVLTSKSNNYRKAVKMLEQHDVRRH